MKPQKPSKPDRAATKSIYGNASLNAVIDAKNPDLAGKGKKRKREKKVESLETVAAKKAASKRLESVKDQGLGESLEDDFEIKGKDDEERELEDILFGTDVGGSDRIESILKNANVAISQDDLALDKDIVDSNDQEDSNEFDIPDGEVGI
jgi:hypothetical protein